MRFRVRALSVRVTGAAAPVWLFALLALCLLSGCQKQDEISRYTVKKMPQVEPPAKAAKSPGMPAGHGSGISERMLGAIASQGRTVWVFKVAGPKDSVAEQMPKFLSLIQSLKFGEDAALLPKWTLPEGWTEQTEDDPQGMRFKTLLVKTDGEDLPLTITRLPLPGDRPIDGMPLMIVNLWCEQLGIPEKTAADLKSEEQPKDAEVQQLEVSGKQITLVNFLAAAKPDRMASEKPGRSAPAEAAEGVPQWKVPEGWKASAGNQFSLAAFAVTDDGREIKTTVSRAGGDLLENLNRWRGQVGLKAWSPEEMTKAAKKLSVDGHDGTFVEFVGNDARSNKPSCILGVIVPRDDEAWFFKLTGDVELAQREKENFEAFVQSVKFDVAAPQSPARPTPVRPAPAPGPITVAPKGLSQWKVPEGWQPAAGNQFSLAAFAVKEGPNSIQTTVSRAGGDLLENLNRWRGQLGLAAWSPQEMKKTAKTLSIDGHDGTLVELVGKDARTGKPSCILGLIVPRDGEFAWFFKLTGDAELAQREKENFEAFVQSVKFE